MLTLKNVLKVGAKIRSYLFQGQRIIYTAALLEVKQDNHSNLTQFDQKCPLH